MPITIGCVVGTRPEALKMAPVVLRLREQAPEFKVLVLSTGQHQELLDEALAEFKIEADDDLRIMTPGQSLAELTARGLTAIDDWIVRRQPNLMIAQGDTASVFATGMAAHYRQTPFAHVEAGLRSGDLGAPFPEEAHRALVARLADLHFAPTLEAQAQLLREGINPDRIQVVGNTIIDALSWIAADAPVPPKLPGTTRQLLMTMHRRENQGIPMIRACRAVGTLLSRHPDLGLIASVHPNPAVRQVFEEELGDHQRVLLLNSMPYRAFVGLMKASTLILTDSGGIQEEGPALGKPILVLRESTERPEAIQLGTSQLVGTNPNRILDAAESILTNPGRSIQPASLYGDGRAAERIAEVIIRYFSPQHLTRKTA